MPAFVFTGANITNLGVGTFYAAVVSAIPAITASTYSQLAVPAGSQQIVLQNQQLLSDRWTFDNFIFPTANYAATLYGIVIIRQIGAVLAPTDQLINFTPFSNSNGQEFIMQPGIYSIPVTFGIFGAMKVTGVYRYTSGAYVAGANSGVSFGLMHLIGTKNGTQAFANPANGNHLAAMRGDGTLFTAWTDRSVAVNSNPIGVAPGSDLYAFDFKTDRVRLGKIGMRCDNLSFAYSVYASNGLQSGVFDGASIVLATNWTLIATGNTVPNNFVIAQSSDQVTFWRYFKFTFNPAYTYYIYETEFYESTIETPITNIG